MKLHILAVGNKAPEWALAGFEEYARRMPRGARIEFVPIRPGRRGGDVPSGGELTRLLADEAERIVAALPPGCVRIALDERGRQLTTSQLAKQLAGWMQSGRDAAFIIGGADGLDAGLKRAADVQLALSALTLPHALARVLLAEQLYRAVSLLQNHPYHRE